MYAEVLNLIERDRLIFGCRDVWRRVVFWIRAEGTDVHLASGDGTVGVDLREVSQWMRCELITTYHNGHEWVLELLVRHLSVDVDTG